MIFIPALNWLAAFIFASFASVLTLGGKTKATRTYALVALCATGWVIGLGAYFYVETPFWLVFWNRYNHVLAGLIAVAFFYYALLFPDREKIDRRIAAFLLILELLFLFAYFYTDIIIVDSALLLRATLDRYRDLFYAVGPVFYLHFFGFFLAGFIVLYRTGKRMTGTIFGRQANYLLWGTAIGVLPPIIADIILPRFGFYGLYGYAGALTTGWVIFGAYAIARHQLFNVRLVLTSIAATSILSIAGLLILELSGERGVIFNTGGRVALFFSFLAIGSFLLYSIRRGERRRAQLARMDGELKQLNEKLIGRIAERTGKLKKELAHADLLLENLVDGLVELDAAFRVVRINRAGETLLNCARGQVVGTIVSPRDLNRPARAALTRITFPGSPGQEVAYSTRRGMRAAVTEVTVQSPHPRELEVATITFSSITTGTGYVKIIRDITAEKEVARSKNAFITTAAHRLRTPLSTIKWSFEELLEGSFGRLAKKQREAIGRAGTTNDHIIHLVNSLLNSAHIEEGRYGFTLVKLDLTQLIADIAAGLEPKARTRGVQITMHLHEALPAITADQSSIRQVFENLIDNAINYTPEGGSVTVTSAHTESGVQIAIADTGIGISKEDQIKLFSKFFRAKEARETRDEGSGLGLYIAKRIVAEHGGTIRVTSEPGAGSTFSVELPVRV